MRKLKPVRTQARATLRDLKALHYATFIATNEHLKVCYQCNHAGWELAKRCDYGWALAKQITRDRRNIERYIENHPDNQEGLF